LKKPDDYGSRLLCFDPIINRNVTGKKQNYLNAFVRTALNERTHIFVADNKHQHFTTGD